MQKGINNKLVIGLLAHVDSGKTTLAESLLYSAGSIRKLGRVDHKDAFLDNNDMERARGITIFSKQALLNIGDKEVTLLDTPGHIDFSAEMERTLQVLDYAILVINGSDNIEGYVKTLLKLLSRYNIPTFIFVNKMDQKLRSKSQIMEEINKKLDSNCIDFSCIESDMWLENIAMCDESLMNKYLESCEIGIIDVIEQIDKRNIFPCFFGSALKLEGIEELIEGIKKYTISKKYSDDFGARVYKIGKDNQGNRLTYLKVTGGKLAVKQLIEYNINNRQNNIKKEEKVNQIFIYSGEKFNTVNEAEVGTICAVSGLTSTYAGQGLGYEKDNKDVFLEPVLSYKINLPMENDVHSTFIKLLELQEEEPQLNIKWNEKLNEIHAMVMGEVQIEILKTIIKERYGIDVSFSQGSIVYKETISNVVEGVGHFEPLRHYAEVHLLIEPGKRGSGVVIETNCSEDMLDKNWQRLIVTHLHEKQHIGVLIGAEITDIKITLVAGKAHLKHTEGGDFRQATYRAVRQGLKQSDTVVLEPVYEYRIEVPIDMVGRALSDVQQMNGTFEGPHIEGDSAVIVGTAPVVNMQGYSTKVVSYTHGKGSIFYEFKGYEPCHNQDEVVEQINYDSEADIDNPTGSVFCSHGSGYTVPWDEVFDYMHVESYLKKIKEHEKDNDIQQAINMPMGKEYIEHKKESMELDEIFKRTYGDIKRYKNSDSSVEFSVKSQSDKPYKYKAVKKKEEFLLVDGYNIIFAWEELKELADINLEASRNKLMDILCNYQGYIKNTVILVFDAYRVEGNVGEIFQYHNIHVVYTKESETADQYIEKVVKNIGKQSDVRVATSDILEQVIIMGEGAWKVSADEFKKEVQSVNINIRESHLNRGDSEKNYLFDHLPDETVKHIEDVRLGKKEFGKE